MNSTTTISDHLTNDHEEEDCHSTPHASLKKRAGHDTCKSTGLAILKSIQKALHSFVASATRNPAKSWGAMRSSGLGAHSAAKAVSVTPEVVHHRF